MPARHMFYLDPRLLAEQPADEGVGEAAGAVEVPDWVNVLPAPDPQGEIVSRDCRILHVDSLEKLAARSNKALKKQRGGGPVDKDHELYGGWFVANGGPAIGWAEEFEAREGKGLFARVDWLPEAKALIGSRQYRYTSAVVLGEHKWDVDDDGWPSTLHITPELVEGFAITNIPALHVTAMFDRQNDPLREETIRVLLGKLFKLDRAAGAAEIRAAFSQLKQQLAEPPAIDELAAARAAHAQAIADLATAQETIAKLNTEAGEAFVESLVHNGKMTPAQRPAAAAQAKTVEGLAQLRALYQNAPQILHAGAAPTPTPAPTAPHGVDPHAYNLARQGLSVHEIARQLQQRSKETSTR